MLTITLKVSAIVIDAVGIIICLLLLFDFGYPLKKRNSFDNRLFDYLLFFTIIIFVSDSITWLVQGDKNQFLANYVFTGVYYVAQAMLCATWLAYCDYKIHEDIDRLSKHSLLFILPVLFVFFIAVISYKYPIFYGIDSNNIYYRGQFYIVYVLMELLYLLYSVFIVINKIRIDKKNNIYSDKNKILIVYPIFPIAGTVIQTFAYGLNITWLMSAISFQIVYFHFQNSQLVVDSLTRINNRYSYELYLEKQFMAMLNGQKTVKVFLAIVDLNGFKTINDTYGHLEGDYALCSVARVLENSVEFNDFIARIGGDEFVLIGERESENDIEDTISKIFKKIKEHNRESNKSYDIDFSIGYAFSDSYFPKTKEQMLREADAMMHAYKKSKQDMAFKA